MRRVLLLYVNPSKKTGRWIALQIIQLWQTENKAAHASTAKMESVLGRRYAYVRGVVAARLAGGIMLQNREAFDDVSY